MKKFISILLSAVMALSFAACSEKAPESTTPKNYAEILKSVQKAEDVENFKIVSDKTDELASSVFSMMGINEEDVDSFAISCSFMNVNAYCVAIVKPTSDKTADIEAAFSEYVVMQQKNMENYLPDQYDIAKAAKQTTTKTGEVVLVMCEDVDTVFDNIKAALK